MAKRRMKKRTQPQAPPPSSKSNGTTTTPSSTNPQHPKIPKSMVLRLNPQQTHGRSLTQLTHDVRSMLEPHTATRLKERRSNKLRDYTTIAGPLGVSHLLMFSRSKAGNLNLRVAVSPRGPTLGFRVEGWSLCRDVKRSVKRARGVPGGEGGGAKGGLAPPLLVMNNLSSGGREDDGQRTGEDGEAKAVQKQVENLTTTIFQSLFPPINPTTTPLKHIKRVLLMDRLPTDSNTSTSAGNHLVLDLRHYTISTQTAKSVPKPLRRLDQAEKLPHAGQKRKRGNLPNLGKLEDVADYLLDPQVAEGFTSGSESEADTDAEVEVLAPNTQKPPRLAKPKKSGPSDANGEPYDRRDRDAETSRPRVEKKGIKLHELGPRLRLRLMKVEEGLCGGKVMWHAHINKSQEEVERLDRVHEARHKERERRREEQKENVERKRKERGAGKQENGEGEVGEDEEMWDDDDDDDDEIADDVDGGAEVTGEDDEPGWEGEVEDGEESE